MKLTDGRFNLIMALPLVEPDGTIVEYVVAGHDPDHNEAVTARMRTLDDEWYWGNYMRGDGCVTRAIADAHHRAEITHLRTPR